MMIMIMTDYNINLIVYHFRAFHVYRLGTASLDGFTGDFQYNL